MDKQIQPDDADNEHLQLDDAERQPCEIWTRVMGYYRPVSAWNAGKQSEYSERVPYHQAPAAYPTPAGQRKLGL
ncbi:MAG: hypothetical protein J7M38_10705 [Armatimonadetes bacterium]|nr:hypothetical protein [Armatimonadota bacterium]